jgi:hypothetical protein
MCSVKDWQTRLARVDSREAAAALILAEVSCGEVSDSALGTMADAIEAYARLYIDRGGYQRAARTEATVAAMLAERGKHGD